MKIFRNTEIQRTQSFTEKQSGSASVFLCVLCPSVFLKMVRRGYTTNHPSLGRIAT